LTARLKFRLNVKGKVIHGPDADEQDNLDDADEIRTVGFTGAAMAFYEDGYSVCERCIGRMTDDEPDDNGRN
jgi:hypothetical protein